MFQKNDFYVPAVRWRTGEYQALLALSDSAKDQIVPLITIPGLEYDFEDGQPKKSVQAHVSPFPKRYKEKWKTRKAWLDINPDIQSSAMDDGQTVLAHVFSELRKFGANAIPVASLDCSGSVLSDLRVIIAKDGKGSAIRIRLEHLMLVDFSKNFADLLAKLKVTEAECDLIVDLGTPAYEPYPVFAGALLG